MEATKEFGGSVQRGQIMNGVQKLAEEYKAILGVLFVRDKKRPLQIV